MVEVKKSKKSHSEILDSRRKALATYRIPVRSGDRYAILSFGAHVMFNMREEIEMLKDPNRGISRVEEVYVRTKKKGRDVIERYTPDGKIEAYPNTNYEQRDDFLDTNICGQEVLIFPAFVSKVTQDNAHNNPESTLPQEFKSRQTMQLLKEEL